MEDLKSWMADEPVSAVPERWYHRGARAVRRHRAAASVAVLGLLVVAIVATGAAFWIAHARTGEHRARKRSETRLDLAMSAIGQFRKVVAENLDVQNQPELKPLRMKLLEEPLRFYQQLREDLRQGEDSDTDARAKLVRATLDLAVIAAEIGPNRRAIQNFEEAIANLEALTRQDPKDQEGQLLLARGHGEARPPLAHPGA